MARSDRFVPQSIKGRLFSLSLLPLIVTLTASFILFLLLAVPEIIDDQQQQLRQTVVAQREFFLSWVGERFSDLRFLDTLLPGEFDSEGLDDLDRFMASQDEFYTISVHRADGERLTPGPNPDLTDRDYFQRALTGRSAYSGLIISRFSGRPLIVFALPRNGDSGEVEQILIGGVPIQTLLNSIEAVSSAAEGRTLLVDGEGRVINDSVLRPAYAAVSLGATVVQEELWDEETHRITGVALEQLRGGIDYAGPYENREGRTVVASFEVLAPGQWYLVGESPVEAVLESLRSYIIAGLATLLFFLLLFLPMLRTVSRSIERPIAELAQFSREVNRENYDVDTLPSLPRRAPREVRILFATFSEMVIRLKDYVTDLQHTAITDPLTGLANRRFLMGEGQRAVSLAIDHRQPVSVLMVDIDLFKRINDTYGHDVGDSVIECAAASIAGATRDTDLVARYGGEEFAVLCPFTGEEEAYQLGERIRLACAQACAFDEEDTGIAGEPLTFTVSVGVACAETAPVSPPRSGESEADTSRRGTEILEGLIKEADGALYAAKRGGRNRVERAG